MSEAERLHGEEHVQRYRETDGAVGHVWRRGAKVLLLTTTRRRTGQPRTTPLIYENAGDGYVISGLEGRRERASGLRTESASPSRRSRYRSARDVFPHRPTADGETRGALAPGGAPVAGLRPLPDEDRTADPGRRPRAALQPGPDPDELAEQLLELVAGEPQRPVWTTELMIMLDGATAMEPGRGIQPCDRPRRGETGGDAPRSRSGAHARRRGRGRARARERQALGRRAVRLEVVEGRLKTTTPTLTRWPRSMPRNSRRTGSENRVGARHVRPPGRSRAAADQPREVVDVHPDRRRRARQRERAQRHPAERPRMPSGASRSSASCTIQASGRSTWSRIGANSTLGSADVPSGAWSPLSAASRRSARASSMPPEKVRVLGRAVDVGHEPVEPRRWPLQLRIRGRPGGG